MQVVLPESSLSAKLILDFETPMSDDDFYDFCVANPDLRIERTSEGEILIVPPAGGESDHQSVDVIVQLGTWARHNNCDKFFGPSAAFILPTRAILSPDAAWVSNDRFAPLTKAQRRKFMPVSPEFVVEVMSPSDRLKAVKSKMEAWIAGGVDLAWLIDPDHQTVYIYRANYATPEERQGITSLAGEGPLATFELDLTDIWAGI